MANEYLKISLETLIGKRISLHNASQGDYTKRTRELRINQKTFSVIKKSTGIKATMKSNKLNSIVAHAVLTITTNKIIHICKKKISLMFCSKGLIEKNNKLNQ